MTKSEDQIAKLWQRRPFLLVFFLLFIVGFGIIVELYYPSIQLNINRNLWKTNQPSAYYMKVRQRDNNGWVNWEVIVSDGVVLNSTLQAQTVDQVFNLLESTCVPRGFVDCDLTFNSQFHYPTTAHSYEIFYLEVEQFTPCENNLGNCFTAMESR